MFRMIRHALRRRTVYRRGMSERTPLSRVLAEVPGRWVAVDRETNELRAVAMTPYELVAEIERRGIRGVAIVRAPEPAEPELVGLG